MRDILEDSALIYRQELEALFVLLLPGIVLGPALLIIAATGLKAGLAVVPLLMLLYLGSYSAILNWAGYQLASSAPASRPLLALLRRAPDIMVSTAPVALLLVAVLACGVVLADQGFAYLALLATAAGFFAAGNWLTRHAYELPLVVVYEASPHQAAEAAARLGEEARQWSVRLLMLSGAPIALAGLLSLWLAWAIAPIVGATVFLLSLTVWMPFGSLCLVAACGRLLGEAESARRPLLSVSN